MAKKEVAKRLGRGLSSLISDPIAVEANTTVSSKEQNAQATDRNTITNKSEAAPVIAHIKLDHILPNKYQPRKGFPEDSLKRLADSIRVSGVIQPIVVRRVQESGGAHSGATWELIAGERRWRAAKIAGLKTLPAVIQDASDRVAAEWALVENLQREDLNPVERAQALKDLRDEFGLTQSQVAEQVGLERATVSNLIRLTELDEEILELLRSGELGSGHGKALLSCADIGRRRALAKKAAAESWSVRRTEREASATPAAPAPKSEPSPGRSAAVDALERDLGDYLGAKLRIKQSTNKKSGSITIHYFDLDHFESLLERMQFRRS